VAQASPGLGTINHTLLTLQSARAAGLSVRAVVLTPWPQEPSRLERSNLAAIERLGFVEVDTLARASGPQIDELARVGAQLPWRRWLGERPRVAQASGAPPHLPSRGRAGDLARGCASPTSATMVGPWR
jgi:hypothetical protein